MPMTNAERAKVIDLLDRLDGQRRQNILSSFEAFTSWLSTSLYAIYVKVKEQLSRFWGWLREAFA